MRPPPPAAGPPPLRRRPAAASPAEDGTGPFHPPTRPEDWAAQDADMAEFLVLYPRPGPPLFGGEPCACDGRWRYVLGGSAAHPIWRCLHCGAVYRDRARLA